VFDAPVGVGFLDFRSGRIALLHPAGRDTLVAGPGAIHPEPVVDRLVIRRDAVGAVVGLEYAHENQRAVPLDRMQELPSRDAVIQAPGGVALAATLTRPLHSCPCSGIVLIHGGGPGPRHELLPWVRYFTRLGLAVLAYDKRGSGQTAGPEWDTFADLATDVQAALEWARVQPEIDPARVGLWAYSQGGWPAAMVAADLAPAFVVTLSVPAVSAAEQAPAWARASLSASGFPVDEIESAVEFIRIVDAFGRGEVAWSDYQPQLDAVRNTRWFSRVEKPLDAAAPNRPFWSSPLGRYYDPLPDWTKYNGPLLALYGGLDTTVPAAQSAARLADATVGNPWAIVVALPRANHGLQRAVTGSGEELADLSRYEPGLFRLLEAFLTRIVLTTGATE
jgi:hypothetical protein